MIEIICATIVVVVFMICCTIINKIKQEKICKHEWETIRENKVFNKENEWIKTEYLMRCKHCGELKKYEL